MFVGEEQRSSASQAPFNSKMTAGLGRKAGDEN